MDAPEFFDETMLHQDEMGTMIHTHDPSPTESNINQINCLHLGNNDVHEEDFISSYDLLHCIHDSDDNLVEIDADNTIFDTEDVDTIHSISTPQLATRITKRNNSNFIPKVQVDGGADHLITPHCELVHSLHPPDISKGEKSFINDASVQAH